MIVDEAVVPCGRRWVTACFRKQRSSTSSEEQHVYRSLGQVDSFRALVAHIDEFGLR